MLYAIFDNFHALVNRIRQDILRVGAENRRFCVFLTLEFEFLTTYEFHDLYVGANSLSHQGASIPPCLRKNNCIYKMFS